MASTQGEGSSELVPMFISHHKETDTTDSARQLSGIREHPIFDSSLRWKEYGVETRWLGQETSDCAVAFDPNFFHGRGDDELRRFQEGAARRDETALLVATIGNLSDVSARLPGSFDTMMLVGQFGGNISGRRAPEGTRPVLSNGLHPADRDLGLRLKNRSATAWWTLSLTEARLTPGGGGPSMVYRPEGRLEPILEDDLGNPVVAVWLPKVNNERWYIVPDGIDGNLVIAWLVNDALPAFAPSVLRRFRQGLHLDPRFHTIEESQAAEDIKQLEQRYAMDKATAEARLHDARSAAEPIRYGLLYETGDPLVEAVAAVLKNAGITVVNLDQQLGTKSADLLASKNDQHVLVEVKSARGVPNESIVGQLRSHLTTWPQLRPDTIVSHGVLIVNHNIATDPTQRLQHAFNRPEFIAALDVPVITSRDLFDWWRCKDWASIQRALFPTTPTGPPAISSNPSSDPVSQRRPWQLWRRQKQRTNT